MNTTFRSSESKIYYDTKVARAKLAGLSMEEVVSLQGGPVKRLIHRALQPLGAFAGMPNAIVGSPKDTAIELAIRDRTSHPNHQTKP